jgi:hypothetical protein
MHIHVRRPLMPQSRKTFLEEGMTFNLADMRRRGYFRPGNSPGLEIVELFREGHSAGEIELSYETTATNPEPWLRIRCAVGGREISDRFELVGLPQPFGGNIWHLRCPETGTLCRTVYLLPGARRFRSRKALDGAAAYRSTHLDAGWRALSRRDKVAQRIYRQLSPEEQERFASVDFPPKPKWTRWPTWRKALEAFVRWDKRAEALSRRW